MAAWHPAGFGTLFDLSAGDSGVPPDFHHHGNEAFELPLLFRFLQTKVAVLRVTTIQNPNIVLCWRPVMLNKQDKTSTNQSPCRWIHPSDETLPPSEITAGQSCGIRSTKIHQSIVESEEPQMSGMLTVPEKEYWTDRINKRIEKQVEAISAETAHFWDRIHRESRERALASLGLLDRQKELDAIEKQRTTLEKRKRQIERAMLAHIRGVSIQDIDDCENLRHHREVARVVERRQAVHQDELLAESDVGQRILELREKKEILVDAVWLARSLKQVQELWSKVAELSDDEPMVFARDALTTVTRED